MGSAKDQTTTQGKVQAAGSVDLFDDDDDHASDDASCTTVSEKRYNCTPKENKLIADAFSSFIKSRGTIREDTILKIFKETESLRYLTKKLNRRQLADKIRSMKNAYSYKNKK